MQNDNVTPEVALSLVPPKARDAVRAELVKHGAIKDGMTDAERVQLAEFQNQVAGDQVEARRVMIAGGADALAQKARVSESWLANNVHQQDNQE